MQHSRCLGASRRRPSPGRPLFVIGNKWGFDEPAARAAPGLPAAEPPARDAAS